MKLQRNKMKKLSRIISIIAVIGLASCSSSKDATKNMSAEELYNHAYDLLEKTAYKKAAQTFEQVETEHPYSRLAIKSKLMAAYSYYRDGKYDDAIIALERFIKYHPGNKDIAYAYYMKGLCSYEQMPIADKAQDNTADALTAFQQLVIRFPDSEYAKDAEAKLKNIVENLAAHEMEIGRFYLQKGNHLSALNRFNIVVQSFPQTTQIEEALYRQVEIYEILGMEEEAKIPAHLLEDRYPDSKWTSGAIKLTKK